MNTTVLEDVRLVYSDIETLMLEARNEMLTPYDNERLKVLQRHFIARKIRTVKEKQQAVVRLHASIRLNPFQSYDSKVLLSFEDRVRTLKEQYRKEQLRDQRVQEVALEDPLEVMNPQQPTVTFTADDYWGRCVNLREPHTSYQQLMLDATTTPIFISYIDYLKEIANFDDHLKHVKPKIRHSIGFKEYLVLLGNTLERSHLMSDPLDFSTFERAPKVGQRLEEESLSSLEQRCRFWVDVELKKFSVTIEKLESRRTATLDEIEAAEARETKLMVDVFERAIRNKKRGREDDNTRADGADGRSAAAPNTNATATPSTNPLDGIPWWLKRQHGLHLKYHCGVCRNTYLGERNYEEHFYGPRHIQALSRLGIQNSRHFFLVNDETEAKELNEKLRRSVGKDMFRQEYREREDNEGHVLKQGHHNALERSGLF
eukprot:PhF_6_TR25786/c0_g1_i1/m.36369/K12827/SF3A3, SAP61, PRP9; splicing factor 3A subunit 3